MDEWMDGKVVEGPSGREKVLILGQPGTIYHQIVIIIFDGPFPGTCSRLLFRVCGSDREIFQPTPHLPDSDTQFVAICVFVGPF